MPKREPRLKRKEKRECYRESRAKKDNESNKERNDEEKKIYENTLLR